jgi:hypothetical protein
MLVAVVATADGSEVEKLKTIDAVSLLTIEIS